MEIIESIHTQTHMCIHMYVFTLYNIYIYTYIIIYQTSLYNTVEIIIAVACTQEAKQLVVAQFMRLCTSEDLVVKSPPLLNFSKTTLVSVHSESLKMLGGSCEQKLNIFLLLYPCLSELLGKNVSHIQCGFSHINKAIKTIAHLRLRLFCSVAN